MLENKTDALTHYYNYVDRNSNDSINDNNLFILDKSYLTN